MTKRINRSFRLLLQISLLFGFLMACQQNERGTDPGTDRIDSLQALLQQERKAKDSLQKVLNDAEEISPPKVIFKREFGAINDPEQYIKEALQEQPELIPIDPVLGGQMEFRQVTLLSDKWVMALYDDGHIQGKSIYEYELMPNGSVRFEEIASDNSR